MAKLHPDIQAWRPLSAGEYAERAVLQQLGDGLPDGFDVFHSVDWSTLEDGRQRFGEIDAVVVDAFGHLVLLEIKAGQLEAAAPALAGDTRSSPPQLVKRYGGLQKDVIAQCDNQLKGMRKRLQEEGFSGFRAAHLLVLPDYQLLSTPLVFPRERIVDASEASELCQRVLQVINQGQTERFNQVPDRARLLLFLANRFAICPDPSARIGLLGKAVVRLSDGLATWVPRIHSDAGLYAIEATAGSGKTQLALRLLQDACAQGLRCLYVCYNRPLADHITRVASPNAQVFTLHELAIAHGRKKHGDVDFLAPGIFERAAREWVDDSLREAAQGGDRTVPPCFALDLLVIDEMQDMAPQWVEALASRLKADGRLYALGDSQQSLYQREPFELAGAVRITCNDNVRSPRQIVDTLNLLRLNDQKVVARCPEMGEPPDLLVYPASDAGGVRTLQKAVAALRAKGVDPAHIAVLTFSGQERSQVLALSAIGGVAVRKFTGRFDTAGNAVWTQGDLLLETLYRFKGQAAPYVILCEVDFAALDDKQRRKLFVGMTRAQLHLTLVMSQATEAAFSEALSAA